MHSGYNTVKLTVSVVTRLLNTARYLNNDCELNIMWKNNWSFREIQHIYLVVRVIQNNDSQTLS